VHNYLYWLLVYGNQTNACRLFIKLNCCDRQLNNVTIYNTNMHEKEEDKFVMLEYGLYLK